MIIGYARVSTIHQSLEAQITALKSADCEKIFSEKQSSQKERLELKTLLEFVREHDTIIVTKLDRLGRNLKELIDILHFLSEKNVNIISLDGNINTNTQTGKILFKLFALFAEIELSFQQERKERAKEIGRAGGRPIGLSKANDIKARAVISMYLEKDVNGKDKYSLRQIQESAKVSKQTIYNYLILYNIRLRGRVN